MARSESRLGVYTGLILTTIFVQHVICMDDVAFSDKNPTTSTNEDYVYVAGMAIPMRSRHNLELTERSDLSGSFLREGLIGSLLEKYTSHITGSQNENEKPTGSMFHESLTTLTQTGSEYDVSFGCLNDTEQLLLDIQARKPYALEMLDADAKIPSGLLQGHWFWFGSYDECVSVQSSDLHNDHRITGQYCPVSLDIMSKLTTRPVTLGLCVPGNCSASDVSILLSIVMTLMNTTDKILGVVCEQDTNYSGGAITGLVVCGIVGLLVCVGTLVDIVLRYTDGGTQKKGVIKPSNGHINNPSERTGLLSSTSVSLDENPLISSGKGNTWPLLTSLMTSFSFIKNTEKLVRTTTASSPLSSLNGMRVLSMWWVILGHTYVFVFSTPVLQNGTKAVKLVNRFSFQAILNGTFSVDTFFFMSGVLVMYLCMKDISEKNGRTRWGMFYFHRFWRLTPAYAFCLMFLATLVRHMMVGPMKIMMNSYYENDPCQTKWWANLLYINNFYPNNGALNTQCMAWSWYLANDMQFFIISPIIIILLRRNRYVGIGTCVFLIVACSFIRLMTSFEYGIRIPSQLVTEHKDDPYSVNPLYNRPYTRITPYIVGMLLGYILHKNNCRTRLTKISVLVGWLFAVVTGSLPVYGLYDYYKHGDYGMNGGITDASQEVSAIYIGFSRLSWSVALAWVVYACATGYGGPVNNILSWKIWAPLGRLTYCAYLVHPIVMMLYIYSMKTAFFIDDTIMIYLFFGNLVASYLVAFVVSMVIEAPMMGLEKVVFKR